MFLIVLINQVPNYLSIINLSCHVKYIMSSYQCFRMKTEKAGHKSIEDFLSEILTSNHVKLRFIDYGAIQNKDR